MDMQSSAAVYIKHVDLYVNGAVNFSRFHLASA